MTPEKLGVNPPDTNIVTGTVGGVTGAVGGIGSQVGGLGKNVGNAAGGFVGKVASPLGFRPGPK